MQVTGDHETSLAAKKRLRNTVVPAGDRQTEQLGAYSFKFGRGSRKLSAYCALQPVLASYGQ